uniref:Uncharacterized protein n=1 Tax=Aegilops tauschii subsp. strangulata TaxID=200361 RepID=A0A453KR39_AEGTS
CRNGIFICSTGIHDLLPCAFFGQFSWCRGSHITFRGRCCFEEVQIIQEQCETGLENRECSHSRCLCWYAFSWRG